MQIRYGQSVLGKKRLFISGLNGVQNCRQKLTGELKEWHKKGIQVFTVNKDKKHWRVKKFLTKYQIDLPVFLDTSKKISHALKAIAVPHWAVIQYNRDQQWNVLKTGTGNLDNAKNRV